MTSSWIRNDRQLDFLLPMGRDPGITFSKERCDLVSFTFLCWFQQEQFFTEQHVQLCKREKKSLTVYASDSRPNAVSLS